ISCSSTTTCRTTGTTCIPCGAIRAATSACASSSSTISRRTARGAATMSIAALLLASLAAGQGEILALQFADEPGLQQVAIAWSGRSVPLVRREDAWVGLIGIDLDTKPGSQAAEVTFSYADGRTRVQRESITVEPRTFPTTELTVEDRY